MDQGIKVKFQIKGFPFIRVFLLFFLMVIAPRVCHDQPPRCKRDDVQDLNFFNVNERDSKKSDFQMALYDKFVLVWISDRDDRAVMERKKGR